MKYYIAENGQQVGPIEENELLAHGVTVNTMVWREGMQQWVAAGQLSELGYLFRGEQMPPQAPQQPLNGQQQQPFSQQPFGQQVPPQFGQQPQQGHPIMPKTWLVESILVTIFCCLPFGIIGIIKAAGVSGLFNSGNFAAAQEASASAGKWTKLGFFIGLGVSILYIIFYVIAFSTGSLSELYSI